MLTFYAEIILRIYYLQCVGPSYKSTLSAYNFACDPLDISRSFPARKYCLTECCFVSSLCPYKAFPDPEGCLHGIFSLSPGDAQHFLKPCGIAGKHTYLHLSVGNPYAVLKERYNAFVFGCICKQRFVFDDKVYIT